MHNFNPGSLEGLIPILAGVWGTLIAWGKVRLKNSANIEKYRTIFKWLGPGLILFGVFLIFNGNAGESIDLADVSSQIKAKLKLPVAVDSETRLDDIRPVGKLELGYFLTLINLAKNEVSPTFQKDMEKNLKSGACSNPNYIKFFKSGVNIRLTYSSKDKSEIAKVVLVPKDCGM